LPEAAAEILMAAAVVGSEFDAAVVAQVLAKPFDEVIEVLDLVLARRLLVELPGRFGRYRFAHALVRQTLEQELSRTRRVRLHHRIALTLEQTGASATELARHFTAGAPDGDADKAVDWLRRAAAEALRSLAYDEAVTQYRAALDALGLAGAHGAEERADLLMLLAGAANKAGDDDAWRAAALEAADIARRLNDPERLARAAFSLLGTLGSAVEVDENVVAVIRDAADLVRADDRAPAQQALLAELLARLGAYLATGSPHDSAAMLDEALEIARRGENPRVLAIALLNSTLTYTLDQNENQARLREAAQIAEAGGDPEVVLAANTGLMIGALLWADRAEFDRSLTEYARVAAATGAVTPLLLNAINHAGAAALDGRYAEAQAAFENARSRAVALRDPSHLVAITAGMLPVTRELGHARDVASARQSATRKPLLPIAEAFHVWALSEAGEREAAAERLHLLLAQPEAILSGYLRRLTLAVLTEATDLLGDTRAAAQLSRWWQSEAGHGACVNVGAHSYHGALERYLGLTALTLNHANEAVHHHQRALGLHERMRAKGWAARSHYDLARALVARGEPGDVERAARLIDETIGSAHELGMPKLLEELLTLGE
jgi:tetratricopeptide (TPR) repeat protein